MDAAVFTRQLQRGFDDQMGDGALSGGGVSAVHAIIQEDQHPEYRFLRLERFCSGAQTDAAVAAQFSMVGLRNPANSGVLIMLRTITGWDPGAAAQLEIWTGTGDPVVDSETSGSLNDLRYGPQTTMRATGKIWQKTNAAQPGAAAYRWQAANGVSPTPWEFPIILPPNSFIHVTRTAVNLQVTAAFMWMERAAEPGELVSSP